MLDDEVCDGVRARLADIAEHVQLLAADPVAQNAWTHPCGWTIKEPYEHFAEHSPCAPIAELVDAFTDMWPALQETVASVLRPAAQAGLVELAARLQALDEGAFHDEIETLDGGQWAEVRRLARETLRLL